MPLTRSPNQPMATLQVRLVLTAPLLMTTQFGPGKFLMHQLPAQ
ncbi:hypothetical protein VCJ_001101 [Vibrio metoecus]|nr:hypothetical protein VCJ_001101 [Vibrio metoecus]